MVKQSICKTPTKDVITQNSLAARCNSDREGQRWQLALDLAGGDVVGIGTRWAACEDGRETEGWTGIDRVKMRYEEVETVEFSLRAIES